MLERFNNYRRSRQGFTLFELLLVLMLIVVVFAMTMPQLNRVRTRGQLRAAADQVRTGWAKARNRAMRTGTPTAFIYLPESRYFAIAPATLSGLDAALHQQILQSLQQAKSAEDNGQVVSLPDFDVQLSSSITADMSASTSSSSAGATNLAPSTFIRLEHIPEQVLFAPSGPDNAMSATGSVPSTLSTAPMGMMSGAMPTSPIVFMPDGTAQDAVIWLQNELGQMISVNLRALTGGSSLGAVVQSDTMPNGTGMP